MNSLFLVYSIYPNNVTKQIRPEFNWGLEKQFERFNSCFQIEFRRGFVWEWGLFCETAWAKNVGKTQWGIETHVIRI